MPDLSEPVVKKFKVGTSLKQNSLIFSAFQKNSQKLLIFHGNIKTPINYRAI